MENTELDDARASAPVERLLEDSWESRSQRAGGRELAVESLAAAAFLAVAVPLAIPALSAHRVGAGLALLLIALYAVVAGAIRFPLGAGYVVPSYLILVPMLVLLPPQTVPLLTAAGLVLASGAQWVTRRGSVDPVLRSIPNAWYAVGPTILVMLAGRPHGAVQIALVSIAAFVSGCLLDLGASTVREAAAFGVAPQLQLQVVTVVWLIDACIAPLGLLLAVAARHGHGLVLMVLPLVGLMWVLDRDRNARIANAQHRLELVGRERTRLQGAVRRLGEAFAAKLELPALAGIVLHSSVEALDSSAGTLVLHLPQGPPQVDRVGSEDATPLLEAVCHVADSSLRPEQLERDGAWALAVPFESADHEHAVRGVLAVSRQGRKFRPDEEALLGRPGGARPHRGAGDPRPRGPARAGHHRSAHRPGQPAQAEHRADRAARARGGAAARPHALRPGRVQELQRHVRTPRRRCPAGPAGRQARRGSGAGGGGVPARRRRVLCSAAGTDPGRGSPRAGHRSGRRARRAG